MAAPFKDDSNKRPNLPLGGVVAKTLLREPKPWWELEEFKKWTPPTYHPTLPGPPLGPKPWWLDPSTLLTLPDPPPGSYPHWVNPPLPPSLPPPSHDVDPPKDSNSLISENVSERAEGAPNMAPAETAGGLLGMLHAILQQDGPKPGGSFDSNLQNAQDRAPPERRLGRRTYRA
jgi:hypothetical protein